MTKLENIILTTKWVKIREWNTYFHKVSEILLSTKWVNVILHFVERGISLTYVHSLCGKNYVHSHCGKRYFTYVHPLCGKNYEWVNVIRTTKGVNVSEWNTSFHKVSERNSYHKGGEHKWVKYLFPKNERNTSLEVFHSVTFNHFVVRIMFTYFVIRIMFTHFVVRIMSTHFVERGISLTCVHPLCGTNYVLSLCGKMYFAHFLERGISLTYALSTMWVDIILTTKGVNASEWNTSFHKVSERNSYYKRGERKWVKYLFPQSEWT
jgi:uncharacterized protein YxeA